MTTINELVINFHMTESCNYRCGYCYATWCNPDSTRELHGQSGRVEQLLEDLAYYFLDSNPIKQALGYRTVRINFAGGEPMLLGERFAHAVFQANVLGFRTSVITNGHYLDKPMLEELAPRLSMLGISYDAHDPDVVKNICRMDRKGRSLSVGALTRIVNQYRALNPTGIFKLNTVVNSCNWQDNIEGLVERIQPDKWKLLRVLPVHDHSMVITDAQYRSYVDRHASLTHLIVEEDNEAMKHSYLMINPAGCFYQNGEAGKGYQQSRPILKAGVGQALSEVEFDIEAFSRRYQPGTLQAVL